MNVIVSVSQVWYNRLCVSLNMIYHMRDVYSEQEEIKGIKVLLTNFCNTWKALSETPTPVIVPSSKSVIIRAPNDCYAKVCEDFTITSS